MIFEGVTPPLRSDPEWHRFELRLRLLPLYDMAARANAMALALIPAFEQMNEAFRESAQAFARIGRILEVTDA